MSNKYYIDIIKTCYLDHKDIGKNDLEQRLNLFIAKIKKLNKSINEFENRLLLRWKIIFMVCASIEANSNRYFNWKNFVKSHQGRSGFFKYFGIATGGTSLIENAYKKNSLRKYEDFTMSALYYEMYGVKISDDLLRKLQRIALNLGGNDGLYLQTRRFKNYPYKDGWQTFFSDLWEIISFQNNFSSLSNEVILNNHSEPKNDEYGFSFHILMNDSLASDFTRDKFTIDGHISLDSAKAIDMAQCYLLEIEINERDKRDLIKYKLEKKTLEYLSFSDEDFLSFFERIIRLDEKHQSSVKDFVKDFISSNLI